MYNSHGGDNMDTVKLVKWGNSMGVRIPHSLLKATKAYVGETFSVRANRQGGFTLVPIDDPRAGWTEAFNAFAEAGEDESLLDSVANTFDEDEWTW